MKKRILVLPISAIAITSMCVYATLRSHDSAIGLEGESWKRRAPFVLNNDRATKLRDSENRLFRLQTYLGRHHIILVFVDDSAGMNRDKNLRLLNDNYTALQKKDVKIVAITSLIPQFIRKNLETNPLPFPVVNDFEPRYLWHRLWKRFDTKNNTLLPGVFHIDRAGQVDWNDDGPKPLDNLEEIVAKLK